MTVGTSILFHSPRVGARAMRIAARRGRDSNEARKPGTSPATVYELTERERVRSSGTRSSQWPSSASGALMTSPRYSTTTESTLPACLPQNSQMRLRNEETIFSSMFADQGTTG
jgi:hypothetical protein